MATFLYGANPNFNNFVEVNSVGADVEMKEIFRRDESVSLRIRKIIFVTGNANDVGVVKDGSDTAPTMAHLKSAVARQAVEVDFGDLGIMMNPWIDFGACTLNTGHKFIFVLA